MKTTIISHNHKTSTKERIYNYIDTAKYPLSQNCLINKIIYKAILTPIHRCYKEKILIGIAEIRIKLWHPNHQRQSKCLKYKTDTELCNEVVQMKKSWQKPRYHVGNSTKMFFLQPQLNKMQLCLKEKLEIVTYHGNNLLNIKLGLISKCKHQNKYMLSKYGTKDWHQLHCKKPLHCIFLFVKHMY